MSAFNPAAFTALVALVGLFILVASPALPREDWLIAYCA